MKTWNVQKTASRGYAIGPAYVVKKRQVTVDSAPITPGQTEDEIARFDAAVAKVQADLRELAEESEIFAGHYTLAADVAIRDGVTERVRTQLANAEYALMQVQDEYVLMFESMDDEYMRERAADMKDVSRRLLYALKGIEDNPFGAMKEKSLVVADDLTPSDTARMDLALVLGFATEEGGVTSHVSIIAKNLGLPCLVGVGPFLEEVRTGDSMILDAAGGKMILKPDQATMEEYRKRAADFAEETKRLEEMSSLPSETKDGRRFTLCVNAGNIEEIRNACRGPFDGVGLFRSEFLYMEKDHFPTEEEQFQAYKEAARILEGRELTIRTLDIGGDKALDYYQFPKEENPFLGYRAIRMCLDCPDVFKTQLRAILRASAFGHIRVMYPMMISIEELEAANALLASCKEELKAERIAFDEKLQTGMMIETPAAVMMAEEFAARVDFFSIGTNDLTQYLLAADRGNQKVSSLYDPLHPAVLRAIYHTIQAAHRHGIKAGMCGEFAGDEQAAGLLLGMGLDEFSMSPGQIAAVKYRLRGSTYERLQQLAREALHMETAAQVAGLLQNQL